MGEFERNFMIMHTSSGAGENIIGDCKTENRGEFNSQGIISLQNINCTETSKLCHQWRGACNDGILHCVRGGMLGFVQGVHLTGNEKRHGTADFLSLNLKSIYSHCILALGMF